MLTPTNTRLLFVAADPQFVRVFLCDQVRQLLDKGFDVRVACAAERGPQILEHELGCPVETFAIARSISLRDDLKSLAELTMFMRAWRPAVVHGHTPKAGLLGALAAWLARVPIRIHTFHGLRSEILTGARGTLVRTMERLTAASSTHCLAVSTSLRAKIIVEQLCPARKLRVLGAGSCAGVAMDQFEPESWTLQALRWRVQHGIAPEQMLVSYIGRRAHDKGMQILQAAWTLIRERQPQARLLVAGPQDATDPCAVEITDKLRADPRVVLLDEFVSNVALLLSASDVFVQPSFREGLGMAAIEASAMRLPVVASRVTGLVDVVESGETGLLVEAGDHEGLASAVGKLLNRPRLRRRMGARGRRSVLARFDRKVVIADLLAFYEQVIADYRPRGTALKRTLDVLLTVPLLLLAAPILLVTALLILVFMGRPILFRQQRAGLRGQAFELLKFRTMRIPRPGEDAFRTDAARTTRLGSWLRRLSLDELPQLWNVLRGDMSLVGPRPLLLDYLPRYSPVEARRHDVRPGITGWAQIHGRNNCDWRERLAHDVWYVDHGSLRIDLLILLRTIAKVVRSEGITPHGRQAMGEFLGNTLRQPH